MATSNSNGKFLTLNIKGPWAYRTKCLQVGVALMMLLSATVLFACQVPVFRYALERWNPEAYPIVIVTPKPISESEKQSWLRDQPERFSSYVRIEWLTPSEIRDPVLREHWAASEDNAGLVATYYPEKSELRQTIASVGALKETSLEEMLSSPARKEIANRLASGQSAVWVLLESGDKEKDEAARMALETQLTLDKEWLKLPTPEEMEIKPEVLDSVKIKLRVDFSILNIKRDDPKETFLINSLLNSEEDLRAFEEPIVFPIFGRGLVLYALIGKGINGDTIRAASKFVCGPCSCQVKEQNPGFDLLLEHQWNESVGDVFISQPIPGTGAQPKLLAIPPGRKK
jgi:hypothetical protein